MTWSSWIRIAEIIGLIIVTGYVFSRTWIFPSMDSKKTGFNRKMERIVIAVGLVLFTITGIAHVLLLTKQLSGSSFNDPQFWELAGHIVTASNVGMASWLRPAIVLLLLLFSMMKQSAGRTTTILLLIAALTLTFPMTGHAVSGDSKVIPVISQTFHILCSSVWFGGLIGLLSLCLIRTKDLVQLQFLSTSLVRFSAIALPMIAIVSVSGIVLSVYRLHSWADLVLSTYGQILVCKVVILLVTLLVAAFHRFIMMPKIERLATSEPSRSNSTVKKLYNSVQVEVALAFVMIVLAGLLSTGSPPAQ